MCALFVVLLLCYINAPNWTYEVQYSKIFIIKLIKHNVDTQHC